MKTALPPRKAMRRILAPLTVPSPVQDAITSNGECRSVRGQLLLGSQRAASDWQLLRRERVTHVLNCGRSYNLFDSRPDSPEYKTLNLHDQLVESPDIQSTFLEAVQWVQSAIDSGGVVLVHCRAGVSRSCAV